MVSMSIYCHVNRDHMDLLNSNSSLKRGIVSFCRILNYFDSAL